MCRRGEGVAPLGSLRLTMRFQCVRRDKKMTTKKNDNNNNFNSNAIDS